MNSAIGFALLSLVFAGVNDVVFKRYTTKASRSRGSYVFAIGVVWTALQFTEVQLRGGTLFLNAPTLGFGLLGGLFLTLSNLLLLESLGRMEVGLGSTIYRLNTIAVVLLSFFLLNEPFGAAKAAGILAGILAVLLLYRRRDSTPGGDAFLLFFGLALTASLFRGAYGVSTKAGLLEAANPDAMLLIAGSCWVVGGMLYAVWRERGLRLTPKRIAYAAVSGVLVFLVVNTLMLAVAKGEASIVIPIANMSFVIALLLSVASGMESLTARKACALGCAAGAILLLSHA